MMPKYAISNGQTIVNVIIADSEDIATEVTGMQAYDITTTGIPAMGWVWDQAAFAWVDPNAEVISGDNE
jgi:hypothetical protein